MKVEAKFKNIGLFFPKALLPVLLAQLYVGDGDSKLARARKLGEIETLVERMSFESRCKIDLEEFDFTVERLGDDFRLMSYQLSQLFDEIAQENTFLDGYGLVGAVSLDIWPVINGSYAGRPYVPFGRIVEFLQALLGGSISTKDLFLEKLQKELTESEYIQSCRHVDLIQVSSGNLEYIINYTVGNLVSVERRKGDAEFVMTYYALNRIDATWGKQRDHILMPREFKHASTVMISLAHELKRIEY